MSRRRRLALMVGASLVGVAGAVLLALGLTGSGGTGTATVVRPLPSHAAAPPPEAAPSSPSADLTPSSPVHVEIPGLDVDLPVLALHPDGGTINPPLLTAAYWIEPYGRPVGTADAATDTLYIAAHSAGRGSDGFDPLLADGGTGSALAPGDVVRVRTPQGTVAYTVEDARTYAKAELPGAAEVWRQEPGLLVLITCLQRPGQQATTRNLVVFARS